MDPKIRNFRGIERLIREDPRRADNLAFEWQRFLKSTVPTSPELLSIETADDFHKWAQTHPEKHIDTSIFVGKEVADSYYYLRELNEERQMQRHGNIDPLNVPTELLALPILAASFLEHPKTMEEDKDYQKIEARLKKEWLKKNPGKDFSSKEGVDYLYGRINPDPLHSGAGEDLDAEEKWEKSWAKSVGTNLPGTFPTLSEEAEREFRNNPKFTKRIERYDKERKKIYKNPKNDPLLRLHNSKNQNHLNARIALSQKEPMRLRARLDEIERMVQVKSMTDFSDKYPEKAMAYDSDNRDKNKQGNNIDTKTLRRIFQSESKAPEGELKIPLKNVLERPSVRSLGRSANSIGRGAARTGGKLASRAGQVVTRIGSAAARSLFQFLAATIEVWGPILLAVLAIVGLVVFIIIFFNNNSAPSSSRPPGIECTTDASGHITFVLDGNSCASVAAQYYSEDEGILVTARCVDSCSDYDSKSFCSRDSNNSCDNVPPSCGIAREAFCIEYSPASPESGRLYDCTNNDFFYGLPADVHSCNANQIPNPTSTPTPGP